MSPEWEFATMCPKAHPSEECEFLTSQAGWCFWDARENWSDKDIGKMLDFVQNLCVSDFGGAVEGGGSGKRGKHGLPRPPLPGPASNRGCQPGLG